MSSTITRDRRPKVGDRAWQVDWCAGVPTDENGDSNMDAADDRCETYATREASEKRAKEVLPLDFFGCVKVTPVEFVAYDEDDAMAYPHAGFWEAAGESLEFDAVIGTGR